MDSVIRLKSNQYAHILDTNTQVTRVEVGPATVTKQEHESLVRGPENMVNIPPNSFCRVRNPVVVDKDHRPVHDKFGQAKIRKGFEEIRVDDGEPFPLYPGEELVVPPTPFTVVKKDQALRIKAVEPFDGHKAGDVWLFKGPQLYRPRIEEEVDGTVESILVRQNEAVVLEAINDFVAEDGTPRKAGDRWVLKQPGAYLSGIYEVNRGTVRGIVVTPTSSVHVKANLDTVSYGKTRSAGSHYLITSEDTDLFIPEIDEEVVEVVPITTLTKNQFCVVLDPVDPATGTQRFGERELRKGECSFFLRPGEKLENGIEDVYILSEDEALLLRAVAPVREGEAVYQPGQRWLLKGPCEYVPKIEIEVLEKRKAIPLSEKEGIYVRNIDDGSVRAVIGHSYMLRANEELWAKLLPPEIEALVSGSGKTRRKPHRVVSFQVPSSSAVQAFDYKTLKSRVVFGPEMVLLQPNETFTVLNLSAGFPKEPKCKPAVSLFLGPDFINDSVVVETGDHASLTVKMSYSWRFDVDKTDQELANRMFFSSDFVGDVCRVIGSKVRGVVATTEFDDFHKNSSKIVHDAIFGESAELRFVNNLVIFEVDVQSVEPVEQTTRDSLLKSVKQAIDITISSQEETAKLEAEKLKQCNEFSLAKVSVTDEEDMERLRKELIMVRNRNMDIEAKGVAEADAFAEKKAAELEGNFSKERAAQEAAVAEHEFDADDLEVAEGERLELEQKKQMDEIEVKAAAEEADIEVSKFERMVKAITPEVIREIASAGPSAQAELLKGLGLQSVMITDGNTPVNLFNTAQGLVGGAGSK